MKKIYYILIGAVALASLQCTETKPIGQCEVFPGNRGVGDRSRLSQDIRTISTEPTAGNPLVKNDRHKGCSSHIYKVPVSQFVNYKATITGRSESGELPTIICENIYLDGNGRLDCNSIWPTSTHIYLTFAYNPADGNGDLWANNIIDYTINMSVIPQSLPFSNNNGVAEMTGAASLDVTSITGTSGGSIVATIPVDTDTGYISAHLIRRGSPVGAPSILGVANVFTSGTQQSVNVTFSVPGGTFTAGEFVYLRVYLGENNTNFLGGTFTSYELDFNNVATNFTYNKKRTIMNSAGLPEGSNMVVPRLIIQ